MLNILRSKVKIISFFCWAAVIIMILSVSACSPKEVPKTGEPDPQSDMPKEAVYEGKVKEVRDYLLEQGLEPLEALTKDPEGEEVEVTWADLCEKEQVIILNAFLNQAISDVSSQNNYSPVNLRKVILLLKDGTTAAEIYFIKENIIGGVTYSKEEISQEEKQYFSLKGESLAQIKHIDYPVWQAGQAASKPAIYYLNVEQAKKDGFERAIQIQSFDQGRFLITFQNDRECRVYLYDTRDGSDFYTGISFPEYPQIRVIQLQEGKTAVILPDKFRIVDQRFKTIEEIKYPQSEEISMDDLDISRDGQTIAYRSKQGLAVSDRYFGNSKVIVASKIGKDPHGLDWEVPRYPAFSPDSSRIMYRYVGYEWLIGTGIISPDGSDQKYYQADKEETTYTKWYDGSHIYSSGPAYGDYKNPVLLNVETGEKSYLVQDAPEDKQIEYFPGKDKTLFYLENKMNDQGFLAPAEFGYYDVGQKSWNPLITAPGLPDQSIFGSYDSYDQDKNIFGFIVHNYPIWSKPVVLAGLDQ